MGTDKALVDFEGEPLVVRVARGLQMISDDVFVVCKETLALDLPEVLDEFAEQTPLSGVITALHAAQHPLVFVVACDMPYVSNDLVIELSAEAVGVDAAVPVHDGVLESLHAVWSAGAASKLEAMWDGGERSVRGALERLGPRTVEMAAATASFTNINTPDDLDASRQAPTGSRPANGRRSGSSTLRPPPRRP
jgi:molybdopterin-guanine dinucleotide biosynthesis protein A